MNCDEPDSFALSHTIIFKFIDIKFSFTLLSYCIICYILRILRLLYIYYIFIIFFLYLLILIYLSLCYLRLYILWRIPKDYFCLVCIAIFLFQFS